MLNWTHFNVSREQLLRLVEAGQLPPLTLHGVEGPQRLVCAVPPKGFVVSFGFSVPAGRFIRGVLFGYRLQLQHLNLNSIQ
jgi:hypothetical protein